MRTDFLWQELTARAKLLDLTEPQLNAMTALAEAAIKSCPESNTGKIEVLIDKDGDLLIELWETVNDIVIANGEWASVAIDMFGYCRMDGSQLQAPIYGYPA